MTIDEAIKTLTYSSKHNTILFSKDDKDALKLGIEALKHIERNRERGKAILSILLPGETKEE